MAWNTVRVRVTLPPLLSGKETSLAYQLLFTKEEWDQFKGGRQGFAKILGERIASTLWDAMNGIDSH